MWCSLALLLVAVVLNIIGLNIGKWLQNAGGVGTYVPLADSGRRGIAWLLRHGSATHFTVANMMPTWNWDTVNFWSQIAFAFTGLELVSCMAEEVRDPRRTLPRAVFGSGASSRCMYIAGTFAVLRCCLQTTSIRKSGVFHAIAVGSVALRSRFPRHHRGDPGHSWQCGRRRFNRRRRIARVPFQVGIDRYLPAAFGKIHPRWRTPWISILVQAVLSGAILLVSQISDSMRGAYQFLVDAAIILYFIPFLYMFAAVIKLASRKDRKGNRARRAGAGRNARRLDLRRPGISRRSAGNLCFARTSRRFDKQAGLRNEAHRRHSNLDSDRAGALLARRTSAAGRLICQQRLIAVAHFVIIWASPPAGV